MSVRPVFLKLLAFFAALAASVAIVEFVSYESGCAACARRTVALPAPPRFSPAEHLQSEVELVTLAREAGRSYTRVRLRLAPGSAAPERLHVRTFFFAPDDPRQRVWAGESAEISRPFDAGGRATVTVSARCDWCDDEDVPESGYFARVQIADEAGAMTPLPWGPSFADISTAAPVVVHVERVGPRASGRRSQGR
jgi:hypothetical protein